MQQQYSFLILACGHVSITMSAETNLDANSLSKADSIKIK